MTTRFIDAFSEENWINTYKNYKDTTVDDTFKRVAKAIASVETTEEKRLEWEEKFLDMLTNFKGTAGGRTYSNAGTEWTGTTLINCFVAPRTGTDLDSLDQIVNDLKNQTFTLKSEGGWGQNFSWIRPRGTFIHGIGVDTPGAVKFMELYDKASEIITSGAGKKSKHHKAKGKIRKGAMMGVLDCLAGTTPINTINGKIEIKDLVGKNPYLYCTDGNGNVKIRQADLVWSKGIRKTIRVKFDNDDFIECTPDHQFMLSDGTFIAASKLKKGHSLAALTKVLQDNYLQLGVARYRNKIAEHNAIYEMKYGAYPTVLGCTDRTGLGENLTIAHHANHNSLDNSPDNIVSMTLSEHSAHHGDLLEEHRKRIAKERKGKSWDEYYGVEKAAIIRERYSSKRRGKATWNKGLTGDNYKEHYSSGFSNQFVENANHKVTEVVDCGDQEVFDISMPAPYHNFAANGVFIHNCTHPDIIEFITAKQQAGRLTKFNISVNCTDEFMNKLIKIQELKDANQPFEEEDRWVLRFPDTTCSEYKPQWDGNLTVWESKGLPVVEYQTISATWLWNLIMESTYNRAEPGVLFLDRANDYNPANYIEHISATNPCLRGDVEVSTLTGKMPISEVVSKFDKGREIFVPTFNETTKTIELERVVKAWCTSPDRELLEIVFSDGKKIQVTPEHKIFTTNRGYVNACELTEDDDIVTE